jgi:hypothetical protein
MTTSKWCKSWKILACCWSSGRHPNFLHLHFVNSKRFEASTYETIHYKKIVGNGIHFASRISLWIGVDVTLVRVGQAGPKIKPFLWALAVWHTIVFQSEWILLVKRCRWLLDAEQIQLQLIDLWDSKVEVRLQGWSQSKFFNLWIPSAPIRTLEKECKCP